MAYFSFDRIRAIGLDIGTSYTVGAVWNGEESEIMRDAEGKRQIPSLVSFEGSGRYIGTSAVSRATSNPKNTIFGFNRLLGRKAPLENDNKIMPFEIVSEQSEKETDFCQIKIRFRQQDELFSPEEITAMLVSHVKTLEGKVNRAALAVPTTFTKAQRQSIKVACRIAGLKVLGVVNQTTAAAIAYGYEMEETRQNVMVINLGGGHLDVAVLEIKNNRFQDLFTPDGDAELGGQDFTEAMVVYCIKEFESRRQVTACTQRKPYDKVKVANLKSQCEKTKIRMSDMAEAQRTESQEIFVPNFVGNEDLCCGVTSKKFEELNLELFIKFKDTIRKVKEEAKRKGVTIDEVVLVGGSTRMPKILKEVEELFNDDGISINTDLNPVEAVAKGTAIYAASFSDSEIEKNCNVSEITGQIGGDDHSTEVATICDDDELRRASVNRLRKIDREVRDWNKSMSKLENLQKIALRAQSLIKDKAPFSKISNWIEKEMDNEKQNKKIIGKEIKKYKKILEELEKNITKICAALTLECDSHRDLGTISPTEEVTGEAVVEVLNQAGGDEDDMPSNNSISNGSSAINGVDKPDEIMANLEMGDVRSQSQDASKNNCAASTLECDSHRDLGTISPTEEVTGEPVVEVLNQAGGDEDEMASNNSISNGSSAINGVDKPDEIMANFGMRDVRSHSQDASKNNCAASTLECDSHRDLGTISPTEEVTGEAVVEVLNQAGRDEDEMASNNSLTTGSGAISDVDKPDEKLANFGMGDVRSQSQDAEEELFSVAEEDRRESN